MVEESKSDLQKMHSNIMDSNGSNELSSVITNVQMNQVERFFSYYNLFANCKLLRNFSFSGVKLEVLLSYIWKLRKFAVDNVSGIEFYTRIAYSKMKHEKW